MFDIKNSKVVLGRYVNKKVETVEWSDLKKGIGFDNKYCTCDCLASYRTEEDVKVGDLYTVWHSGRVCIMQVDVIVSRWEYSDERYGAGNFDTMSTLISKVDLDAHAKAKATRTKIKNMRAALDEILAARKAEKELNDAIKELGKEEGAELKEMMAQIKALENGDEVADAVEAK